jgi:renalase
MSKILIIGAGLSGLCAARELKKQGHNVIVVDKGLGIGGRMATRRFEGATFDHGAQFFTARSNEFRDEVDYWITNGVAKQWFRGYPSPNNDNPDDTYPRFCGTLGMTGIAKFLGQDLDVHLNEEIETLSRLNGVWNATSKSGTIFQAEKLILTAPAKQSLTLFDSSGELLPPDFRNQLETLTYAPCFAVLCVLDGPSAIPAPGLYYVNSEPVWWISDNFQKGISPVEGAITIHSSVAFAKNHYDTDPNEVGQLLIEAANTWLGNSVKAFQVRRWRYSKPENALAIGAIAIPEQNLFFAGDALGGEKIEGAFQSGIKTAQLVTGEQY